MSITPEEIERLRGLDGNATAGPWTAEPCNTEGCWCAWVKCPEGPDGDWAIPTGAVTKEDAAFIAAARKALPRLLDEVERLRSDGFRCVNCDTLAVDDQLDGYCEHCR